MAVYRCTGATVHRNSAGEAVCDYEAPEPWRGRCPGCGRPYDWQKFGSDSKRAVEVTFASVLSDKPKDWVSTGMEEVDRVLGGGGLVRGAPYLLGGQPGSGKSTLVAQVVAAVATERHPGLYVTMEETVEQVAERARRIRCQNEHVKLLAGEGNFYAVAKRARAIGASILALDSIQKFAREMGLSAADVMEEGLRFVKESRVTTIFISQLAKDNSFSGSRSLEYDVDVVLYMGEYDTREDKLRLCEGRRVDRREGAKHVFLLTEKNRHGAETQTLCRMDDTGLVPLRRRVKKRLLVAGGQPDDEDGEDAVD